MSDMSNDAGKDTSGGIAPSVWKVSAVVMIGPFMTQVDSTVVNVSLSTISAALMSSIVAAQWIISGYLLAMALMLPLNGWLVDRIGAKRLYIFCFGTFTLASLLCGAARSMDELICARVFQGLVGGVMAPMAQMMIARVAGKNMARVMGYTTLPILVAPVLGPVLAGAILAHASWPWLFYLNLPVGMLGIALAVLLLPGDAASLQKRPFDLLGFALISPGLVAFIYGLHATTHRFGQVVLLTGVVFLGGFVWHSVRKGATALIDVRIFANKVFSVAAITQFSSNGMFFGRQLIVPLYLITGCGLSASDAGWLIAATGAGMMCSFPLLGFLTERFGCRAVSAGGALLAFLSMLPFLWMIEHQYSMVWTLISLFAAGVGQGTINIPTISAAYSSIPKARIPVANTALNIAQRIGGPVTTTVLAVVIATTMRDHTTAQPHEFLTVFVILSCVHLLTLGATSRLPLRIERAA